MVALEAHSASPITRVLCFGTTAIVHDYGKRHPRRLPQFQGFPTGPNHPTRVTPFPKRPQAVLPIR